MNSSLSQRPTIAWRDKYTTNNTSNIFTLLLPFWQKIHSEETWFWWMLSWYIYYHILVIILTSISCRSSFVILPTNSFRANINCFTWRKFIPEHFSWYFCGENVAWFYLWIVENICNSLQKANCDLGFVKISEYVLIFLCLSCRKYLK